MFIDARMLLSLSLSFVCARAHWSLAFIALYLSYSWPFACATLPTLGGVGVGGMGWDVRLEVRTHCFAYLWPTTSTLCYLLLFILVAPTAPHSLLYFRIALCLISCCARVPEPVVPPSSLFEGRILLCSSMSYPAFGWSDGLAVAQKQRRDLNGSSLHPEKAERPVRVLLSWPSSLQGPWAMSVHDE